MDDEIYVECKPGAWEANSGTITPKATADLNDRQKAAQRRIADLRLRLLDLSNSNRLLNYRFSSRSRRQIRIVDELPDQILEGLVEGKRLVFKSLPEPGDLPDDEKTDEFLLALEQAKGSDEEYLTALQWLGEADHGDASRRLERSLRDRLRKTLGMPDRRLPDQPSRIEWAKRNGGVASFDLPEPDKGSKASHFDNDIRTLLLPEEMERALSTVRDQARGALQETGINTLYLALGCLEWYETVESQSPMYEPLLLHPVDMERKLIKGKCRYSIGSLGETEVNVTLSERLHQDFRRRLPVFKDEDMPEEYFREVAEAIDGLPGWRVRRFVVLGHFSFARLAMFHDLEDSNWPAEVGIIGNPVISELFAGADVDTGAFFADEYEVDDPAIAVKVPLLITDADSSQFSAIVDVMDRKNLAIKGPTRHRKVTNHYQHHRGCSGAREVGPFCCREDGGPQRR